MTAPAVPFPCPACRSENSTGAKFCGACGAPLTLACPRCGTQNPPAFKFCSECGAALATGQGTAGAGGGGAATAAPPAPKDALFRRQEAKVPAYTPSHLADKILTSAPALEGERKSVSVLFADVAGFTQSPARYRPKTSTW